MQLSSIVFTTALATTALAIPSHHGHNHDVVQTPLYSVAGNLTSLQQVLLGAIRPRKLPRDIPDALADTGGACSYLDLTHEDGSDKRRLYFFNLFNHGAQGDICGLNLRWAVLAACGEPRYYACGRIAGSMYNWSSDEGLTPTVDGITFETDSPCNTDKVHDIISFYTDGEVELECKSVMELILEDMEDAADDDTTGVDATGEDTAGEDTTREDTTGADTTREDTTREDTTGEE